MICHETEQTVDDARDDVVTFQADADDVVVPTHVQKVSKLADVEAKFYETFLEAIVPSREETTSEITVTAPAIGLDADVVQLDVDVADTLAETSTEVGVVMEDLEAHDVVEETAITSTQIRPDKTDVDILLAELADRLITEAQTQEDVNETETTRNLDGVTQVTALTDDVAPSEEAVTSYSSVTSCWSATVGC